MSGLAIELAVILLLLALNGVFAMSELAILTARKVRLEQRAEDGDAGAKVALALAHDPTQFLSTVQVGITLIGVLAGAFGGATISDSLAVPLRNVPALARYADGIALAIVVTGITYLSLVIGELVPKRVALSNPERVASWVARPMRFVAKIAAPVVVLLTGPTNLLLRLFGIRASAEPSLTAEEIMALIEQGAESGVVQQAEHELVEGVFRLGDRLVADVMTPRLQLEWLNLEDSLDDIRTQIVDQPRSVYLVCDGTVDNVLGVMHAEHLLARCLVGETLDVRAQLQQPLFIPSTMTALKLLDQFRASRQHIAIVLDEFGGVMGAVVVDDLLEAIVGPLPTPGEPNAPIVQRRDDHTWLMAGTVPLEDVETLLDLAPIPDDARRGVRTLGGFVMTLLGRLPMVGDAVEWNGLRASVESMNGRRIDRVVVAKTTRHSADAAVKPIQP